MDLVDDGIFAGLRARDDVREDMLDRPNFVFSALGDGGGKGGARIQATQDQRFYVKEVTGADVEGLRLLQKEYRQHIEAHAGSLLARIYFRLRRSNGQVPPPPRGRRAAGLWGARGSRRQPQGRICSVGLQDRSAHRSGLPSLRLLRAGRQGIRENPPLRIRRGGGADLHTRRDVPRSGSEPAESFRGRPGARGAGGAK